MSLYDEAVAIVRDAPASIIELLRGTIPTVQGLSALASAHPEQEARKTLARLQAIADSDAAALYVIHGAALATPAIADGGRSQLVVSAPFDVSHRETAGVLASLIGSARRSIIFCSYVIAYVEELLPLLRAATSRGVSLAGIVDRACSESAAGAEALKLLRAASPEAKLHVWSGVEGTLHAKFLVVDSRALLISSANLTGRALIDNVEVGVTVEHDETSRALEVLYDEIVASHEASRWQ